MDGKKDSNNNGDKKKGENIKDNLSQLEQDLLAKNQGRGGASRPAAVSVESASRPRAGLTQLEQDVAAKQAARPTGVLSQLEQDVMAKQAARPMAGLSQPEQDVASKQAALTSAGLSQLEQDVAAKQSARGGASSRPGAVSANSGGAVATGASNLSQIVLHLSVLEHWVELLSVLSALLGYSSVSKQSLLEQSLVSERLVLEESSMFERATELSFELLCSDLVLFRLALLVLE